MLCTMYYTSVIGSAPKVRTFVSLPSEFTVSDRGITENDAVYEVCKEKENVTFRQSAYYLQ